jgi:predicted methyltransferase
MNRFLMNAVLFACVAGCSHGAPPQSPPSPTSELPAASAAPAEAGSSPALAIPDDVRALVDAPDRSSDDKALDAGRHPAELLAYFGVKRGMRVAELAAGGGYTAELLARAVGPTGKVYGVNSPFILQRFAEKPWSERLQKPVMSNVVRLDREFDDPFPAEVSNLDVVFCVLFYHDMVWQKVDRQKLDAAVMRALKPGGIFAIVDHSARPGAGIADVESLHRIEESFLRDEITKAGFELVGSAGFLKNPQDTRDWSDSPRVAGERRGKSDRFVLMFKKP